MRTAQEHFGFDMDPEMRDPFNLFTGFDNAFSY